MKPPSPLTIVGDDALGVGLGELRNPRRRPLILGDPAVVDQIDVMLDRTGTTPADVFISDRRCDPELITSAVECYRTSAADTIVAIGGGSVMDLAKLVAAEASHPGSLRRISRRLLVRGHASLPDLAQRRMGLMLSPTTIGTGSQESAVAIIAADHATPHSTGLVASPQMLVADHVAYDPRLLQGPQELYDSGILEVLARLIVPYVSRPSAFPHAEYAALSQLQELGRLIRDRDHPNWLQAAILSGATHSGWAMRGRSHAPSLLWFVAMELSIATGISKNEATAILLPEWIERVRAGQSEWGEQQRLGRVDSATGGLDHVAALCAAVQPTATTRVDVAPLAETTIRRWGGRATFNQLQAAHVSDLLDTAMTRLRSTRMAAR